MTETQLQTIVKGRVGCFSHRRNPQLLPGKQPQRRAEVRVEQQYFDIVDAVSNAKLQSCDGVLKSHCFLLNVCPL